MPRIACLLGALTVGLSTPALADPDLVIETTPGTAVAPEDVEAALHDQLPELVIATGPTESAPAATARVVIEQWPDGRLSLSYRDALGRETVRVLEPGDAPAANIAMVVFNLQQDQLDLVLGDSGALAAPAPRPAADVRRDTAAPRVRAAVGVEPPAPLASVSAGLGFSNRHLLVEVEGSDQPRSFTAPGYISVAVDADVFPGRLFERSGLASWIGLSARFVRDLYVHSTGVDVSTGQPVDIDTAAQELRIQLALDGPLAGRAAGPRVRLGVGWSTLLFQLDPSSMAMIDEAMQIPTFAYQGLLVTADGDVPLGSGSVRLGAGLSWFEVLDVGQAVRDLFGADTEGARGFGAHATLRASIVPRLDGRIAVQFRRIATEMTGVSSYGGGAMGGFPAASDQYVDLFLALAYRVD